MNGKSYEELCKELESEILGFKLQMGECYPFYGEILFRVPILQDEAVKTACTDGKTIWYNPKFFAELSTGQRSYVLLHEVFHILLLHNYRREIVEDGTWQLWNIACDRVVNHMVDRLSQDMRREKIIACERPNEGIFGNVQDSDSAESLYAELLRQMRGREARIGLGKIHMQVGQRKYVAGQGLVCVPVPVIYPLPSDLRECRDAAGNLLSGEEMKTAQILMETMIREAVTKSRSAGGSYYIPRQALHLTESKLLPWKTLLQEFLEAEVDDETSYATPERKYLHMGLIIPGHQDSQERLEELWAFVDSSGSIADGELSEFLTQLYRIVKEFGCRINICYWDTKVTDVYRDIHSEKEILRCLPRHSGGTDINCVYKWIIDNKIRPETIVILTDGYFGTPLAEYTRRFRDKTILVLSRDAADTGQMKTIGKLARL